MAIEYGTICDAIKEFESVNIRDIKELTDLMKEELVNGGIECLCDFSKIEKPRSYAKQHKIREHTMLKLRRYYLHGINLMVEGMETLLNYYKVYDNEFVGVYVGEFGVKSNYFIRVDSKYPTSGMKIKICDNEEAAKRKNEYQSIFKNGMVFKTKKDNVFLEILVDGVSVGMYVIQIEETDIQNGVGICTGKVVLIPAIKENKAQENRDSIRSGMIDVYFLKRKLMECIGAVSLLENGIWYTYKVYQLTETTFLFQRLKREFSVCETRYNEKGERESVYCHEMGTIKIKCVEGKWININVR